MSEAKPCPKCGSEVVYVVSDIGLPWWAQCSQCEHKGPMSESHSSAVEAWNEMIETINYAKVD